MTIEKSEYRPIMLHGWTHLPTHLWPDNIPVNHLPWVFRDVANYHPYQTYLHKSCVYIRPVQDELLLTIEQLSVHWLGRSIRSKYPFHPLQIIPCERGGKGPLYISARTRDEFAIPSVIINFYDGEPSIPECEDGPMRFTLAQKKNLPAVLTLVMEQHYEEGEYQSQMYKEYFAPIDPKTVQVRLGPDMRLLREELNHICGGKRWDHILERGYFHDGSSSVSYTPDLSRVPTFIRETDFLSRGSDTYEIESGQTHLEAAENAGLSSILVRYRDILRIDNDALIYHNHLDRIRRSRQAKEMQEKNETWIRSIQQNKEEK